MLLHDHLEQPLTLPDTARPTCATPGSPICQPAKRPRPTTLSPTRPSTSRGGFLIAGYSHVVGTLWTADDEVSTRIANAFYTSLLADDTPTTPAQALHMAVRAERCPLSRNADPVGNPSARGHVDSDDQIG
ncbi:CHAT domain-containing protein [Streptomyces sp. NPDC093252]|uniref:CHAT domain-containing protein n=1 Tax=Streptomyces sp. NPDC093252 TaxID=3154980 RepID=UPI00341BDDB2